MRDESRSNPSPLERQRSGQLSNLWHSLITRSSFNHSESKCKLLLIAKMTTLQLTEGDEQPPVGTPKRRQLLPNLYDGMANIRPSALYALIPRSFTSYDSGYRKVTYSQLANAVNGVAWLISGQLGQGKNSETLAYVGPNDIGYIAVILGASKAGYSVGSSSFRYEVSRFEQQLTDPADPLRITSQHQSRSSQPVRCNQVQDAFDVETTVLANGRNYPGWPLKSAKNRPCTQHLPVTG